MTLNRNKSLSSFRCQRHAKKTSCSAETSHFNVQNDLKAQQATVEFQVSKAYQKIQVFYQKHHISISRMALNRNKPPSSFRPRRHAQKLYRTPRFNFQNDLKSQHTAIEFQVSKACQTYKISTETSHFNFQNDLESQHSTIEFQVCKAYQRQSLLQKHHISISRMTLNRYKPPSSFRSPRHTQKIKVFWQNITFQFPEWPWIPASHRRVSSLWCIPKIILFYKKDSISRMTLNHCKPP